MRYDRAPGLTGPACHVHRVGVHRWGGSIGGAVSSDMCGQFSERIGDEPSFGVNCRPELAWYSV